MKESIGVCKKLLKYVKMLLNEGVGVCKKLLSYVKKLLKFVKNSKKDIKICKICIKF